MNWIESEFSLSFSDLFAEWEWLKILNLKSLNRFMRYYKCKYIFACVTQGKIWLWYLIIWIIMNKFFPSFEKTSKRFIYIKFFISNEKKIINSFETIFYVLQADIASQMSSPPQQSILTSNLKRETEYLQHPVFNRQFFKIIFQCVIGY